MFKVLILIYSLLSLQMSFGQDLKHESGQRNIIKVSPAEFSRIAQNNNGKVIRIPLSEDEKEEIEDNSKAVEKYLDLEHQKKSAREPSRGGGLNFGSGGGGGGGREAALLIFAIVGLVIVLMWVPYFPTFAYEAYTGKDQYKYLHMFTLQVTYLETSKNATTDPQSPYVEQRTGYLTGIRYGFYLKRKSEEGRKDLGITAELGTYNLKDENRTSNLISKRTGGYWMIGPSLLVGGKLVSKTGEALFMKIDLLGGSSINSDFGIISRADVSFNLAGESNWVLGIGFGGIYLNTNKNRGIISETNDVALIGFTNLGYVF